MSPPKLSHSAPVGHTLCPDWHTLPGSAGSSRSIPEMSRRFIQFSGHALIVVGGDLQPFLFAGVFPQLECPAEVLAGPREVTGIEVLVAQCVVGIGKIRIKLDGALKVRQGRGGAFLFSTPFRRGCSACRASSDEVVACSRGTSNFSTVANDSPSSPRSLDAASPSTSSTFFLRPGCDLLLGQRVSALAIHRPQSSTYLLPRLPIAPAM